MMAPNCPEHRSLVFDFARGRLDDRQAMRAEDALEHCECCRAWWDETFSGPSYLEVEEACTASLNAVELPPRRRAHRQLWAAAAMIAVVLGVTALWQTERGPQADVAVIHETISNFDFEPGTANQPVADPDLPATGRYRSAVIGAANPDGETVAKIDFEKAVVIADTSLQSDDETRLIGRLDFESGSLAGLTPNT